MLAVSSAVSPAFSPRKSLDDQQGILRGSNFNIAGGLQQLLASPVEFVEGSSSGIFAVPEGKYEPVNKPTGARSLGAVATSSQLKAIRKKDTPTTSLYISPILLHYPEGFAGTGTGFLNTGNTCFLNSVLQGLLHLPPLMHILMGHKDCASQGFCATCKLREVMVQSYDRPKKYMVPKAIASNLTKIAKHFRLGRQEDAHEFLRFLIEALQKSCTVGLDPKLDHKLAETSWVHKVFGGRLRSRIKCRECGHPSDTFDSILDLSIDVHGLNTIKEALHKFVKLDVLKGADRYKCDKCKRAVVAEKGFTLHHAPPVLTIHLKRFTPFGRKLTNVIRYDESLDVKPFMSEGQFGPLYKLCGVISHAGGGPNSGHYYAFVRTKQGQWYEMNDESVERRQSIFSDKGAYILFYVQERGEILRRLTEPTNTFPTKAADKKGHVSNIGQLLEGKMEEDTGVPTSWTRPSEPSLLQPARSSTPPNSGLRLLGSGQTPVRDQQPTVASSPDPQVKRLGPRIDITQSPASHILPSGEDAIQKTTSLVADYESDNEVKNATATSTAKCTVPSANELSIATSSFGNEVIGAQDAGKAADSLNLGSTLPKRQSSLILSEEPLSSQPPVKRARPSPPSEESHPKRGYQNPFGARSNYTDSLSSTRSERENMGLTTSSYVHPRQPGIRRRMKKRLLI